MALGGRLGLFEGAVRLLIDLDHRSHIGQIDTALHSLGRRLTVAMQASSTGPGCGMARSASRPTGSVVMLVLSTCQVRPHAHR